MKKIRLMVITVLGLILLVISCSFAYHRYCLSNEESLRTPIGKMVSVNGHKMSVYQRGSGPRTLVFLSGAGTISPILDFKDLYDHLTDKYRIVVVERAGYGFSEDTTYSRDVGTVLSETRQALIEANVSGPYILVSHSMASIESLLWQELYPNEIQAIIALDWALPASYKQLSLHQSLIQTAYLGSKLGLLRYFPEKFYLKNPSLTSKEEQIYKALAYNQFPSRAMVNENRIVKENAQKVSRHSEIHLPILMFVSNGDDTSFDKDEWQDFARQFAQEQANSEVIFYDAPHYLYHYHPKEIAIEIEDFIENH